MHVTELYYCRLVSLSEYIQPERYAHPITSDSDIVFGAGQKRGVGNTFVRE